MAVPFHKNLTPKFAPEWSPNVAYNWSSIVWYEGVLYVHIGEDGRMTGPPTTDTYAIEYQTVPEAPDQYTETVTERAWIMIEPRIIGTINGQPLYNYLGPTASITSANIRGFGGLAKPPPNEDVYFTKGLQGTPAYEGNVFFATSSNDLNKASWMSYYDSGEMTREFGQAEDIFRDDEMVGTRTVKNKYLFPCGQIPQPSTGGTGSEVSSFGQKPFGAFAKSNEDNQGWLDSRREGTGDTLDADPINLLTETRNFTVGFSFSNYEGPSGTVLTPMNATMITALLGSKIGYRCVLEYYEYEQVTIPAPYIGDPDTTAYHRSGGTLTLVSGDGVSTPRVYRWDPPYDELVQLEVATGQYTLTSTIEGYTNYTPTNVSYQITNKPWRPVANLVLYNDFDPEHPRA